ncbi:MAG: hypothetical protein M1833_002202 [Piccolia ochrophora]|nr:MAG: hypothetical protein M1833_002202 [Piccolia ochrophora]
MLSIRVFLLALFALAVSAIPLEGPVHEVEALARSLKNLDKRQWSFPGWPPRPRTSSTTVPTATATPTPPAPPIPPTSGGGNTRNDINNGVCKDVSVIYARGTGEPGNVGYQTGPSFFTALNNELGAARVAVQGVAYPATAAGNANGGASGAGPMVAAAQKAVTQCPNTKIVLSGYSQGAMVVHAADRQLPANLASKVAAVVLFGDPFNGRPLQNVPANKVRTFCHTDDSVCRGSPVISAGHLNYYRDAPAAAQFVADNL